MSIVNIRAYINPKTGHCYHSQMFRAMFVNNKNLHPDIKSLKMEVYSYTAGPPAIYLYNREDDQKPFFSQQGNSLDMRQIEGVLLHRLGIE